MSCCCNLGCQINSKSCCYCDDTRSKTQKNTIYIDEYRLIDLSEHKINVPVDMYYCNTCKKSTESLGQYITRIKKDLPSPAECSRIKTFLKNSHKLEEKRREEKIRRDFYMQTKSVEQKIARDSRKYIKMGRMSQLIKTELSEEERKLLKLQKMKKEHEKNINVGRKKIR